ncbi:MAG TPA: suppressor of fused domain protein [Acidimicrobiales bacterium]|nr:suppressor of fused domain protein [Acidimicrobiales bacterium]
MSRGSRAIDAHVAAAEGGPPDGRHLPPAPPRFNGGRPLHSVTTHRLKDPDHWHLVTYGLSEMEYKETEDPEVSGWGFELTMRVAGAEEPLWAVDFLNTLAAYVWTGGHPFAAGHHLDLGGPMRLGTDTALTAAVTVADPGLGPLDGPFGAVEFLQVVGLTADELEACRAWRTDGVVELMGHHNPLLITDLGRRSVLEDPVVAAEVDAHRAAEGSSLTELRVGSLQVRPRPWGGVRVTLGAGAAAALGPALRRELVGDGARFSVAGDGGEVSFVAAPEPGWHSDGGRVTVFVPLPEVPGLAAMFTGAKGGGRRPAWPRLRFQVVP